MSSKKFHIFIVLSPTTEIISSRIIESIIRKKNCKKSSILILYPANYHLTILEDFESFCFDELWVKKNSEKNLNFDINYYFSEFIKFYLYKFRRYSNNFGKRIFKRIGKLPASFSKILDYSEFVRKLNMENKEIIIFTPNVKVHIFQILLFYTNTYDYQLIEEGVASFKSIKETEFYIQYKPKIFLADFVSLMINFIFNFIRTFLNFIFMFFKKPKFTLCALFKYLSLPIFNVGLFYLGHIKPVYVHKISKKAFLSMEGVKKISYLNESNFELIKIEQVSKIVENIKTDKINLIILPGDNLNILKDEFKISKLKNLHSGLTVLRPHPRLSKYDIALLSDLLSIKLTDESIKLSEDLRFIPVDFLMKFKKFNLIFQGVQKSSLQIYCDDQ